MSVLIIAEAGVNHENNYQQAEQLIEIAAEANVDIFKTQSFKASDLVTATCPPAIYQIENANAQDQLSMLAGLELPEEWHEDLKQKCEQLGLEFLSTAFSFKSFDYLAELGMQRLKIPSGELSNLPFIIYQAHQNLPMILSTGMSTIEDIKMALAAASLGYGGVSLQEISMEMIENRAKSGFNDLKHKVSILHCTSNYPVSWNDVNIRSIGTMQKEFGLDIGYSDHTVGLIASLAAVAFGATIIEKHYTISREFDGKPDHPSPDHAASLEPEELKALVEGIRLVEQKITPEMNESHKLKLLKEICEHLENRYNVETYFDKIDIILGSPEKMISEDTRKLSKVAEKSIVALKDIKEGEIYSLDNLALKRPAGGLKPQKLFDLLGKPAKRDYIFDNFIEE